MTTARNLRLGEAVLGGGVLALGLFITFETANLEVTPSNAAIGPTLFPFLIAGGLLLVGALVLREALFGHIAHERRGFELDWPAVAFVSAGLIVQMFLLETLGWIAATTLLFLAVTRAFGSRRLVVDAVIGLVLSSLAFGIFNYGLGLGLPAGSVIEQLLPAGDEDADS